MLVAVAFGSSPAAAQFSDSYNFIKAVKDRDVNKAIELADKPGTTVVNVRDSDTGEAAVHIVTRRGDLGWLGLLYQKGANLNVKDRDGNTPLILAAIGRWSEGAVTLIRLKAQVNAQNRLGETAVLKAVQARDLTLVKALIDAGANPDIADNSGISARIAADNDPRATSIAKLLKDVPVKATGKIQGPSL
ncbi:ankyrin repeat domain-containing protein [Sandarakinorhabdus oryzae]|uniref:ankyrin repeat domain-containing protein n=1 Tax=Sandarakinorhabdus oryzae TaxID=2675220 RepID=UPI001F444474|nr:ankyrin repeat domain-containing protein [Sandarakinorhabdus oryzae]